VAAPKKPTNICLISEVLTQKDVMIVAEQPTTTDDQYGRAFVGRGLKEIKKFLEDQGFSVHCTYALKCPKPNRDMKAKPAYVKACRNQYLAKEIAIVKPKHIIVLGSNALNGVLGKGRKLTEVQGTRFEDPNTGAWIYTTIHFAQALYSEENKQTMWAELKLFAKWIKHGVDAVAKFDPPVYVVKTLKGLRNMMRRIERAGWVVGVDTETDGLNPYHPDRHIRTIQFCWDPEFGGVTVPLVVGEGCYYTDKENLAEEFWPGDQLKKAVKIIRKILFNARIIWHNGKYDRIWLYCWGQRMFGRPILCPNIYLDTMHVAYLLNENRALKLKRRITEELGYPSYDIPDKMTKDLDLLFPYGTRDTVGMVLLAKKYAAELCEEGHEKLKKFYFNVMRRADKLYTKMELRGWPVHAKTAKKVVSQLEDKFVEVEDQMHSILRKRGIEVDSKVFASPTKLAPLIWEQLGLMPNPDKNIAYTDRTFERLSTDENALVHVKHDPFIAKLLELRSISKALQTYATPMLRAAERRGKITTSYKLAKVVTGRTASGKEEEKGSGKTAEGMNLQNIPPDKPGAVYGIKSIIRDTDPDYWIVEVDFSQIELRIAGELSRDQMLLWAYANNVDLHTYRAMRVMGVDEDGWAALDKPTQKDSRNKAKPVNFGYLYGMSAFKFRQFALVQYGVVFSLSEAKQNREIFFRDHHGLDKWYGKQERMGVRLGYVETLSGRRRRLPDLKIDPETAGGEAKAKYRDAVRQAINSPVQGFGSDLKMMAAIEIDMMLDPEDEIFDSGNGELFGEVHDSILIRMHKSRIREQVPKILEIMRHPKLLDILGIKLTVPIEAEAECGPSLGEKKELKEWSEELLPYAA